MSAHVAHKHLYLAPLAHHFVNQRQRARRVRVDQLIRKSKQKTLVRRAEHTQHKLLRQPAVFFLCVGKAHVHDRPRVAHAAFRRAGNARKRRVFGLNLSLLQRDMQPLDDLVRRNAAEIKPLAAGEDRCREFLRLGCRQNKHDIGGRLFQRLEQRVERALGKHVYLVNDIHAVAPRLRRILHLFAQIADLIHAVVAGRVDFQNIEAVFLRQRLAGGTHAAGIAVFRMLAVDRAGKYLRRRGFARAARAAEQIRMRDTSAHNLAAQRFDDRLLTYKILKPRRTIAAVQRLIAHLSASTVKSRI